MVGNSDPIVYMYMEVIICQSLRSLESLLTSQTPSMGGYQITQVGRRNVDETLPAFWMHFTKPFLLKIEYSKPSKIIDM